MAPIPGTDNVGIEIPNPKPQMVRLSETLGSVEFTKSIKDNLTNLAIGK
jgi:DNA segregation ATPase FtsK/SpoIIIE-like protein